MEGRRQFLGGLAKLFSIYLKVAMPVAILAKSLADSSFGRSLTDTRMSESTLPDLSGKTLGLKYDSGSEAYAYIGAINFEVQAGRLFLVGTSVNVSTGKVGGLRVCVAWDAVTSYFEFDSPEECRKWVAIWYPSETKKKFRFWS
jgi:hypothetical protein